MYVPGCVCVCVPVAHIGYTCVQSLCGSCIFMLEGPLDYTPVSLSLTKPNGSIIIPQNIAMYAGVRTAIVMAAGVAPAMIKATVFRIVPPCTAAMMANI